MLTKAREGEELFEYAAAQIFARKHRCSTCWGIVQVVPIETTDPYKRNVVRCQKPNCSHAGFVTVAYVEKRLSEDHADYVEARHNLGDALGIKSPVTKTTQEIENLFNGG